MQKARPTWDAREQLRDLLFQCTATLGPGDYRKLEALSLACTRGALSADAYQAASFTIWESALHEIESCGRLDFGAAV